MKISDWSFKQNTEKYHKHNCGNCFSFTAETEEEKDFVKNLKAMIEDRESITKFSRKSFDFDQQGDFSISIEYKN